MVLGIVLTLLGIGAIIWSIWSKKEFVRQYDHIMEKTIEARVTEWKVKHERNIREDAHQRSRAVGFGKTIEHFVPFMEKFPVEPAKVQFLGNPIDFICFDKTGSKGKTEIHFIEVKSGNSQLSQKQVNIKDAILKGRVYWHEVGIDTSKETGVDLYEKMDELTQPQDIDTTPRKRGRKPKEENNESTDNE